MTLEKAAAALAAYQRAPYETSDDFFVRIGREAVLHHLTWEQAAAILNKDSGEAWGECAYRKRFKAFWAGMQYQAGKSEGVKAATRILCISDLHIPFQKPLNTFEGFAGRVDILQLNGDVLDCQAISRFPKVYRKSPMDEITEAWHYLRDLLAMIQPKKVMVNYGNHDLRFQNYLAKSLDTDLIELMPRTPLELIFVDGFTQYNKEQRTKRRYEPLREVFYDMEITYNDSWYTQIGKTVFCHPLAFSGGIMSTAEKARRYFKDEGFDFTALVMAHTHRTGHYDVGNTTIYEQGAACDTGKMNYADGRLTISQREGFMYICQDETGNVIDDLTRIIKLN